MVTANRAVARTACVLASLLLLIAAAVDGVRVNGDASSARRRLAQGNSRRGQAGIGSPCSQPKDCQPQITCCIGVCAASCSGGPIPPAASPSPPPTSSPSPAPTTPGASPGVKPSTAPAPGVSPVPPPPPPPPIYVNGPVLNPACVAKYQLPLLLPPIMPKLTGAAATNGAYDQYIISAREILQAVLPPVLPANAPPECTGYDPTAKTRVWAYGTDAGGSSTHNWPSYTIEATRGKPVQVLWGNELVDSARRYRPHLFADQLDQTLHWANPAKLGGMLDDSPCMGCPNPPGCKKAACTCNVAACTAAATSKYNGPVPLVTHVHGMEGVQDNSDGYSEAWFMPDAVNLAGYATNGTWYDILRASAQASNPGSVFGPGAATYTYPVSQRPAQLWFHDHVLGITRLNVYAGLAGFFMVRNAFPQNGPELPGLPYPPPGMGPDSAVRELPLAIQDRAFDTSNQLYYPKQDALPAGDALPTGPVPPTWVPEFFASLPDGSDATLMTVNGRVAPRHDVAKEPYRLRILNGCNAKSLIIYFSTTQPTVGAEVVTTGVLPFWVVGNEAGFFPSLVGPVTQVLLGPAERYDVIFDFSTVPGNAGSVYMLNKGPGVPFDGANVGGGTTIHQAQVMRFDVLKSRSSITFDKALRATLDAALRAEYSKAPTQLPAAPSRTRQFALLEYFGANGNPMGQFLGNVDTTNPAALQGAKQTWMDPVAAVTGTDAVEEWTVINLTGDAHPIHMHEGLFEVVKQEAVTISPTGAFTFTGQLGLPAGLLDGQIASAPCDTGTCFVRKDTTLIAPGYATTLRFKAASRPGLFMWHCHLLEHEDNEMMRPFCIGNPGYVNPHTGRTMCA